jgi:hypothetical protein
METPRVPEPEPAPEPPPVEWAPSGIDLERVQSRFSWPRGYGRVGPFGGHYLVASLLLSVPSGRTDDVATVLVEDGGLRDYLHNSTARYPQCHSGLQEPHGGGSCASWDPHLHFGYSSDPGREPLQGWNAYARQDGPRQGRGVVKLTIRLLHPRTGEALEVARTALECNMRRDLRGLLDDIPPWFADRAVRIPR